MFLIVTITACRSLYQILINIKYSPHIFEHISNIRFTVNPFDGNRVSPSGKTDTTELEVCFRNFASAPKK